MIQQNTTARLEDPNCFHFKDLWLSSTKEEEQKLVELFCFGDVKDVPHEICMTPLMWRKLRKLTLLGLATKLRCLSFKDIMEQCHLTHEREVEEMLVELRSKIDFRIDGVESKVKISRCFDCRDVYGGEQELLLLTNLESTKQTIIEGLVEWKRKLAREICDNKYL